jgi:hypothetical protein
MPNYRARVAIDLLYEAEKPLSSPQLVRIANRTGTYLRTGAVEDLDGNRIQVLFDETYYNQHAHHHDARYERCRPDTEASGDGLGPIE